METKEEFIEIFKNSVKKGEISIDKNLKHVTVEKIAETLYQIKKDIVEDFKRADLATKINK